MMKSKVDQASLFVSELILTQNNKLMIKFMQGRLSRHFILYAFIGVVGVLLDLISFYILEHYFNVNYQLANAISTSIGITNNFLLNTFFNFRRLDKILWRYLKFYTVGVVGLAVTALFLYLLVEQFTWVAFYAKALTIGIVFLLQYGLNKKFSFGS